MEFLIRLANFAGRVLRSPGFWIAVLIGIVVFLLVTLYRRAKLRALDQVVYSRQFSTDGIFVGETLELIEKNYGDEYERTGYFAAVNKGTLFAFAIDGKDNGGFTL